MQVGAFALRKISFAPRFGYKLYTNCASTLNKSLQPNGEFWAVTKASVDCCWRPYIRALKGFHARCIQAILHVHWWDKIPRVEICRRAGATCLETIRLRRQLTWLGHVIRMPANRIPCRLLYSELLAADARWGVRRSVLRTTLSSP